MPENFVTIHKKYDQALDVANSQNYNLSIQLALDGFYFCLFSKEANKFLSIESYTFPSDLKEGEVVGYIEGIIRESEWLRLNYDSVVVLYESPKTTLIPAPLFDKDEIDTIAGFNFKIPSEDKINCDKLINTDAFLLYHSPLNLTDSINKYFPGSVFRSHAGIFIEILLAMFKNLPIKKRMFVNVRNAYLDLVITEGKNLLFFNSFHYQTKEDFIYYIIFVIEQLNLNPEEIELHFTGQIDKNSDCFDFTYKYVRNISFMNSDERFAYSYIFSDIPSHYYFNLFNSGLCEL